MASTHDKRRYVIPENEGSPDAEIEFLLALHDRGELDRHSLIVYAQSYIQQFGGIQSDALGERLVNVMTTVETVEPTGSGEAS